MAMHGSVLCSTYTLTFLILTMSIMCKAVDPQDADRKSYIVYLGSLPDNTLYVPSSHHISLLERVVKSNSPSDFLLRSYKRSFNGFAAKLTDQESETLANIKEVVSVFPSTNYQLHTTRSWDFVGLNQTAKRNDTAESDVIIGVIDSGITPDSESFSDEGFGPPPKKWKGVCEGGEGFSCNNKLIGARFYNVESAIDEVGHGTHTASTAAGNAVKDVSFFGIGQGTARGGVPSARIAAYKVCDVEGCTADAILAAFDDAIADGVDILTVSLGGNSPSPIVSDPIAIGAFHANVKGILTANSAGNNGPAAGTTSSIAPWILSVAASTTDRRLIDKVVLGNGKELVGASINSFKLNKTSFPLIDGKDAAKEDCDEVSAGSCIEGCLDTELVKGKIVVCNQASGSTEAHEAGAVGALLNSSRSDVAFIVPLPAAAFSSEVYDQAKAYLKSTDIPKANILKTEVINDDAAPTIASFSARGPSDIFPEIIKPDITAPGVDILAAYSPNASLTNSRKDTRSVKYSILSGTSMSCPHVAGVAAYIKTFHPDWSADAIKSAIMTTAWVVSDNETSPGELAYGSGHINPVQAVNPGIVYDSSQQEYIGLLCSVIDEDLVQRITGNDTRCPVEKGSARDHNYPSLASPVPPTSFSLTFNRRVKNVGPSSSATYKAKVTSSSSEIDIKVVPQVLSFKSLNEEKNFTVTVTGSGVTHGSYVSASLVWSDGTHSAQSPILLTGAESA